MANPVLIQKQIKDNSEDLHNFVRDLNLWEEEMKRKDRQLSNDKSEEILPPVRRAKLATNKPPQQAKEKREIKKRILSHDYKSWDNFDVDKACEEIDNEGTKSEEDCDEDSTKQQEMYLKEKALYEKEMGNKYVKACKWAEAIEAYSTAVTCNPTDPIFYANRALCHLKLKQYDRVEADCTEALKLDQTYVKAYLRRAAAREAVSQLEDARHDLRRALQLEPNNPQALRDLDRLKALGTKAKAAVKQPVKGSGQIESVAAKSPPVKEANKEPKTKQPVEAEPEPPWKPCGATVQPISKPPHLRSKKSLKRIEIHDIGPNLQHECARLKTITEDVPKTKDEVEVKKEVAVPLSPVKLRSVLTVTSPTLPPPPRNAVQFHTSWNSIKHDKNTSFQFLKQIRGEELANIFKESLDSTTVSGILSTLAEQFTRESQPVLPYLRGLTAVRRFSTITLFMSATDTANLRKLFEYCLKEGECSTQDVAELRRLYEIA